MQTIRILALLEATSITGTAKAVLEFAYEAARLEPDTPAVLVSVAIFSRGEPEPKNALTSALERASIPFHVIGERRRFDLGALNRLKEIIACEAPDILWTNSIKSHFLVRAGKLHSERKWVAYHHGYTTTNFKMRLYNQVDRWSLPCADRVLTVCHPFAMQLARRGVHPSRIRVQHMPVRQFVTDSAECSQLRQTLKITGSNRVILSVGRLSHEKGHIDLVRAFALLPKPLRASATLILVGDGPERARLEHACKKLGLTGSVLFAGHRDDVKTFYGIADVFALPSYTEGSPNVLLEAMAARVPVVATEVGGVPELADNGRSAVLVKAHDPDGLSNAISQLLEEEQLRERLKRSACNVVARHSPETYFRSVLSAFKHALASGA